MFILAACSVKQPPFRVAIGIHTGTPYYDCTKAFLDDCQRILDGYFSGTVGVEAPFLKHWKSDIIQYAKENKVPLDLTYSCLMQDKQPCGKCSSCKDRQKFLGGEYYEC